VLYNHNTSTAVSIIINKQMNDTVQRGRKSCAVRHLWEQRDGWHCNFGIIPMVYEATSQANL